MCIKKMLLLPALALAVVANGSVKKTLAYSENEMSLDVKFVTAGRQEPVRPAPDLLFKNEKGESISLKSLKGKVVFINLWATWCPPCIYEMPTIHKLRKMFKAREDLVFILVDVDGNLKKSRAFMKKNNFDLPVYTMDGKLPYALFDGSIPTTILIDKNNNVLGRQLGETDYMHPEFIKLIKAELNK